MNCGVGKGGDYELYEDKKCRVCGLADEENLNIFKANLEIIITNVYPIVLYKNDPLPKSICKKCLSNAISKYHDIQKVNKLQSQWIENVEIKQPSHNYLQVLDIIKNANETIKNLIQQTFSENISSVNINRLLISSLNEIVTESKNCISKISTTNQNIIGSCLGNVNKKYKYNDTDEDDDDDDDNVALSKIASNKKASFAPAVIQKCRHCDLQFNTLEKLAIHQVSHLQIKSNKLFTTKHLNKTSRRGRLIWIKDRQCIRCLNCWYTFDDNKAILEHWSKAECDFYCSICGKEFPQNPKMMREHVIAAHGISFKSLKNQKDRFIKANTTCSLKDSKLDVNFMKATKELQTSMESPTSTTYVSRPIPERSVKCRICLRNFHNFQACNSHMKVHKPPYSYNESAQLPLMNTDVYMKVNDFNYNGMPFKPSYNANEVVSIKVEPAIENYVDSTEIMEGIQTMDSETPIHNFLETNLESSNSPVQSLHSTQTSSKICPSAGPRGIRMKFVSRRNDLNNMNPSIKVKSLSDLQGDQTHNDPTPYPPISTPEPVQKNTPLQGTEEKQVNPLVYSIIKNESYGINFT